MRRFQQGRGRGWQILHFIFISVIFVSSGLGAMLAPSSAPAMGVNAIQLQCVGLDESAENTIFACEAMKRALEEKFAGRSVVIIPEDAEMPKEDIHSLRLVISRTKHDVLLGRLEGAAIDYEVEGSDWQIETYTMDAPAGQHSYHELVKGLLIVNTLEKLG